MPGWGFLTGVALLFGLMLLLFSGLAPVPGPPVREWLGLAADDASDGPPGTCVTYKSGRAVRGRVVAPRRPPTPPGRWRREPRSPLERSELQGAALGGRIYLATGYSPAPRSVSSFISYDPRNERYERLPDSPFAANHAAFVRGGDELFLVGGFGSGRAVLNDVAAYSPESRRWRTLQPMRRSRGALAAGVIAHRLYAVGGVTSNERPLAPFATLEIYDLETRRWSMGPDMPTARHHLGATTLGGKLYVVGGRVGTQRSVRTFERFDPQRRKWEKLPPLPQPAAGIDVEAVAGKVIVTGGENPEAYLTGKGPNWVTPASWAFDPKGMRWTRLPDLNTARHGYAAGAVNGRLYVFEGSDCPGPTTTRTAESLKIR